MKFYEKLILLRKQKGISQEELADSLDVSRQAVYKWESGASMPDLTKLEKLTRFFKVSYDYLLNDETDAPEGQTPPPPEVVVVTPEPVKTEFRDVFVTANKLSGDQAGYEHGYVPDQTRRNKDSDEIFAKNRFDMKNELTRKGYSNIVYPQSDLCLCYFENIKNKTFGIYFNHTEQFVCPFENLIDVQVSNNGSSLNYDKRATGVGVGFGSMSSISVGSMPMASLSKPSFYTLTVIYFDKKGQTKEYKLDLTTIRLYTVADFKKAEDVEIFKDLLSDITANGLNAIVGKMKAVMAQGAMIRSKEIAVEPHQVSVYGQQLKIANKVMQDKNAAVRRAYAEEQSARQKKLAVVIGIIILILIIVIATNK